MGPEEEPTRRNAEGQIAAELAALSARVDNLERELVQLRPQSALQSQQPAPPPPKPPSAPSSAPVIDFTKHLPKPTSSLEDRIGSQLFSRIGIVALLIAITLFLKWAIDNHWIGPIGRILAGLIAGTAVVLWSERFRRNGFPAFSYSLKAIGSGALYLSLWAAFQLYHLLPATVALAAMVLVTAWNAFMAWSQNSQLLAAYALAGAFATPLLLSTGGNHEVFLFTYILAIDVATVTLVRLKPWPRLIFGAFPVTVAFFIAWYTEWYGAYGTQPPLAITTVFIALFFLTFVAPSLHRAQSAKQSEPITDILLPLANAIFAALALYSVLQDAGHHGLLPWCAVLFAAIYLGLMRLPQSLTTSAVHLSLAIVFLTVAIPLKASGHWITVGWLAEGVALLWVSARLATSPEDTAAAVARQTLRKLAVFALALGFCCLVFQPLLFAFRTDTAFLNTRFATSLFGVAALAASAGIALHAHHRDENRDNSHEDNPEANHEDKPKDAVFPTWLQIAAASIIAFNLSAVLTCVRELDRAWRHTTLNPDADLQKSLAISAFLMLYGAALLAAGFWRRSAFLRWQALILLVFTIAKTFLYDLRNLSQGYRILSFLGLGALLMAISFAYQKDWLALRSPEPAAPLHPISQEEANP
jgi:uncharacterized membrane protein